MKFHNFEKLWCRKPSRHHDNHSYWITKKTYVRDVAIAFDYRFYGYHQFDEYESTMSKTRNDLKIKPLANEIMESVSISRRFQVTLRSSVLKNFKY